MKIEPGQKITVLCANGDQHQGWLHELITGHGEFRLLYIDRITMELNYIALFAKFDDARSMGKTPEQMESLRAEIEAHVGRVFFDWRTFSKKTRVRKITPRKEKSDVTSPNDDLPF